jgi:aminoglycoside phosphotransferase (APT) family kinase protein
VLRASEEIEPDLKAPLSARKFVAESRSLNSPEMHWSQPLRRTGKIDLVLRVAERRIRPFLGPVKPLPYHIITVVTPKEPGCGSWIDSVIAGIAARDRAQIHPHHLARIDWTDTKLAIGQIAISPRERWALKIAMEDGARERLRAHSRSLTALRSRRGFPQNLLRAVPEILETDSYYGYHYALETWIGGEPASVLMYRKRERELFVDRSIEWITLLHRATIGPGRSAEEYSERARSVLTGISSRAGKEDAEFSERVARYLRDRLEQLNPPSVQGHGDFWLGNVMVDRRAGVVTGVIDWDQSDPQAPPLEDVLHMLFQRKGLFSVYDPCAFLAALVSNRLCEADRKRLSRYMHALGLDPRLLGPFAVLYWVRYLASREWFHGKSAAWYRRAYVRVRDTLLAVGLGENLEKLVAGL